MIALTVRTAHRCPPGGFEQAAEVLDQGGIARVVETTYRSHEAAPNMLDAVERIRREAE